MRRRDFTKLVGSAIASWPLAARALAAPKRPTIGFMGSQASVFSPWTAAFVDRLGELGWIEGRNVSIEYRWAEGRPERNVEIAAEFVRLNVNVIVTFGSAVPALKRATAVIPIVFAVANDPVGGGLVASLARPGGNVTGLSVQGADLASKRLELLHELVPNLRLLAIMADAGYSEAMREMEEVQATATRLGVAVLPLEIRRDEDVASAFEEAKSKPDALYVVTDSLVVTNRTRIIAQTLAARLPAIFSYRDYVQAGGLMSYGVNFADQYRRCADLVDRILRGTKPGEIPVEQPTKFELVINHKTAKALGLSFPQALLATADEVIE